jgi:DNA-directed RNA polymerase specialized sigma24 family protein
VNTDIELLESIMNGCDKSYGELIERYHGHLSRFIKSRLPKGSPVIEDVLQETLLSIHLSIIKGRFKHNCYLKTWFFSIANNKVNDYYRKQYKEVKVLSCVSDFSPFETIAQKLGISTSNANVRMHRAAKLLKETINEKGIILK